MKKYILYAEDDQDDFWLLKQAFRELDKEAIELINVPTGYDVIKYLQELDEARYPSLILLDLVMPTLNGRETLDYLRMDDRFKNIPVVCISTSASPKEQTMIKQAGTEVIRKPDIYEEWITIANQLTQYCSLILMCAIIRQ